MPIAVNIPGMENVECKCCGSWLKHWEKHSGGIPGKCRSCGKDDAEVGGHVKRFMNDNGRIYIVPMCRKCSSAEKKLDSFLVTQKDFISAGACFEELSDISDTDDADTEFIDS